MRKKSTARRTDSLEAPSTYAERVQFLIWWAVLELGIEGATKLSVALGKSANTLSKWVRDQPSFEQSEVLAKALDVNATWLHNPNSSGAVEPELFAKWLRSTRLATQGRQVDPPTRRRA